MPRSLHRARGIHIAGGGDREDSRVRIGYAAAPGFELRAQFGDTILESGDLGGNVTTTEAPDGWCRFLVTLPVAEGSSVDDSPMVPV